MGSNIDWNLNCGELGKEENCSLPRYIADGIKKDYQKNQDLCIKKYK
jgi:hypothetical protein